mgnify:CR=1 FL=1
MSYCWQNNFHTKQNFNFDLLSDESHQMLEEYGAWGGDGFSKYDLYYDMLGIGVAVLIDKWWKPKEDSKWERRFNTTSISIHYRLD